MGLELGGNDPAYVCADSDVNVAVENLMDGAMYNSGQSCCGIQRIYIDESIYDSFVLKAVQLTKAYKLGNPLDESVNLGPVVNVSSAERIRSDIQDALSKGAKALIDESLFPIARTGTAYVAPQILVNVNDSMKIIHDEVFGPVVALIPVKNAHEALKQMNSSQFGLTASIWTKNVDLAESLSQELEFGTVFMNRCDYLDPELPWIGVKNSGRGHALSEFGFDSFIRLKSCHFRL